MRTETITLNLLTFTVKQDVVITTTEWILHYYISPHSPESVGLKTTTVEG